MTHPLRLTQARIARYGEFSRLFDEYAPAGTLLETSFWRLHGYGETLIPTLRRWRRGERVMDAGCGFSPLPSLLAERYGVEMWGVDDFGGPDGYWRRNRDLDAFLANNPVKHVLELIGDPAQSTLPGGYFDAIYTKYGIHLTPAPQIPMWRHLGNLLSGKSGSAIYALVVIGFASDGVPAEARDRLREVAAIEDDVARGLARDGAMSDAFWMRLEQERLVRMMSPYLYGALLMHAFGVKAAALADDLRAEAFCLDPSVVTDPSHTGLLEAVYTKRSDSFTQYRHGRRGAVLYTFERA